MPSVRALRSRQPAIQHDVDEAPAQRVATAFATTTLWKIAEAQGAVVQGLGNRNGDRRVRAQWSLVEERRGGKRPTRAERLEQIREAGGPQSLWIHRDARVAWEAILNGGESGRGSDSE